MRRHCTILALLLLLFAGTAPLWSQTAPATSPASQPTTAPAIPPNIPLAEIVTQSDALSASLESTNADLANNPIISTIDQQLSFLTAEVATRSSETDRIVNSTASLDALRSVETSWQELSATLTGWQKDLTSRVTTLDAQIKTLHKSADDWNQTRTVTAGASLPTELTNRINSTIDGINKTLAEADRRRGDVLRLQAQVAAQNTQVVAELKTVRAYREQLLGRLFVKDSPPLWSPEVLHNAGEDLAATGHHTLADQFATLRTYCQRRSERFGIHGLILALLAAGLFWARGRFEGWVKDEPTLAPAAPVFASPISTAFVLSMIISIWLHVGAPRLFWVISGSASIVPAALLIRRLTERFFHPLLYALVVFYFTDQIRSVILSLHVWPRVLLLVEVLGASFFLLVFTHASRHRSVAATGHEARRHRLTLAACRLAICIFVVTLLANVIGFVNFAMFLGGGALRCAYIALIIYAGLAVADGLVIVLLHIRPIARLRAIKGHAMLIRARSHRVLGWGALALWLYVVLNILMIREPVLDFLTTLFTYPLTLGALSITLGNITAGVLTVWGSFLLSRFIRFLLNEEVYTHVNLPRGIGTAVNSLLHYFVLVFGFALAAAALGFPLTNLTILTGAFGVGLGFGLQTIINNFFSGIIVLLERPVQIGDVIEMDAMVGTITRIGIRASVIRTPAGSEIIMPNGRLVAEKVINWTLSDRCRGFELPISIDSSADPHHVIQTLVSTAASVKGIASDPPPIAQVVSFAPGATTLNLRVWTSQVEDWMQVRSDLNLALRTALEREKIPLK